MEDNSPRIYPATIRKELSAAAALNLTGLTYALQLLSAEMASICLATERPEAGNLPARGLYMAIAFEAGRRCGVQQAIGITPAARFKLLELIEH